MVIEQTLLNHFRQSFEGTANKDFNSIIEELNLISLPKLSFQHLDFLNRPFTNEGIEYAVFQLGPYKAPGPDGVPAFFYQEFWEIVKADVLNSMQAFFHSGFLLKALNHTYITLIPKTPFPEEISHFRLISLCNVIYKGHF